MNIQPFKRNEPRSEPNVYSVQCVHCTITNDEAAFEAVFKYTYNNNIEI